MGLGGQCSQPFSGAAVSSCWFSTAATHFTFLREIPMFSQYEMRASIMSWDNKWVGVIAN